ncbi:MAG: Holliday junction branch migration protein RuvA [Pseudomonadota bacterium]
MIGQLRGKVVQKQPPSLVMDVEGVGYELEAPMGTFYELPDADSEVTLSVHMVVREDAQMLFGFIDQTSRDLFRTLLKINGVGPRVGLAILSTLSSSELIACVRIEDVSSLVRVPGIGKKTAERMIIELRDRLKDFDAGVDNTPAVTSGQDDPVQDAVGALMALGYRQPDALRAVKSIQDEGRSREDLIRLSLQILSKR